MKVVPLAPNPEYAEKREKRELIGFVVTASQISDPTLEALERARERERERSYGNEDNRIRGAWQDIEECGVVSGI